MNVSRYRISRSIVAVWAVVLILAIAPAAFAQLSTGSVNGLVTDESGAPMPGVTVTAKSLATGESRTVVTNDAGSATEVGGFTYIAAPGI